MNIFRRSKPVLPELIILEAFFLLIALSFYRCYTLSKRLEALLLILCLIISVLERDRKTASQNSVLFFIACSVWFGAIYSPAVYDLEHPRFVLLGAVTLGASLLISAARSGIREKLSSVISSPGVIIIAALFLILSIPSVTEVPILDSGAYYGWMRRVVTQFDYTFREMPYYCFYDHLSPGYGIFVLAGELWAGGGGIGLHAVNLLLSVSSIGAFWSLTGRMTPDSNKTLRYCLTSCYAFLPSFLGLSGLISLDLPLIPLSVLVIWAYMTKYELLFAFFSWVFVLTKEPAAIYFLLMCLGILIFECRCKGLPGLFRERGTSLISAVSVGIWWIFYYLAPGRGAYGMAGELFISEGEDMHGFGFTIPNLTGKAAQFFILDFNWLIVISAVAAAILIIRAKITLSEDALRLIFISSFLSAGIILFNIFYLDYLHPRYIFVFEAPLIILTGTLISNLPEPIRRKSFLIPAALSFFLLFQSFFCPDILTRRIVFKDSQGIFTAPFSSFGDGKAYNRECSYPVKSAEKALALSGYSSGDRVAVPGLTLTGYEISGGRIVFSESGNIFVKETENADIIILMPWSGITPPEDAGSVRYGTVTARYYRNTPAGN